MNQMDLDQRSTLSWKTLNCILRDNFKYCRGSWASEEEMRKLQQYFDLFAELVDTFVCKGKAKVRFLLSGSVREGVSISPLLRENIAEMDIMFSFKSLKIKFHHQTQVLLDVPLAPGHVKLCVCDPYEWREASKDLGVECAIKEVPTPDGEVKYFLLAQPDADHPRAPFDTGHNMFDFSEAKDLQGSPFPALYDLFFGPHGFHEATIPRCGPAFTKTMGATKESVARFKRGKDNLVTSAPFILTSAIGRRLRRMQGKEEEEFDNSEGGEAEFCSFFTDIIETFASDQKPENAQVQKTESYSAKDLVNENLKSGIFDLCSQALGTLGNGSQNDGTLQRGADAVVRSVLDKVFPSTNPFSPGEGLSHTSVTSMEYEREGKISAACVKGIPDSKNSMEQDTERGKERSSKLQDDFRDEAGEDPLFPRVFDKGGSFDFVPSIECEGWPIIANNFLTRQRQWPPRHVVDQMVKDGFHVVPKCSYGGDRELEWRISFSKAEITLFESMTQMQRVCYRMFKSIYYCELRRPKVLCSYFMKTIFLWTCERLPVEVWEEENLAWLLMGLLDSLLHCLVTKTCEHYFIPQNNMFEHIPEEFLLHHARTVSKIRTEPDRYPSKAVQEKLRGGEPLKAIAVNDDDDDNITDDTAEDDEADAHAEAVVVSGIDLD